MRFILIILFISLAAAVWVSSNSVEVSPGTEVYTGPEPSETAIDVSGIIVQM